MTPKEAKTRLLLKCLFMSEFAGKEEAEMEDLFPEKLYLDAVREAHPDRNAFRVHRG